MKDGHDDLLSQAVNRNQREEIDLDHGLDHTLSPSLDTFEEKKILDDAIDIADMFESDGPSLVMVRKFPAEKGKNPFVTPCVTGHRSEAFQSYKRETDEQQVRVSKIVQGQSVNNGGGKLQVRVAGHCFTKAETTQNFTNANIRPKKTMLS